MKIHKADINKIIKINGLKEVSNTVALDRGIPTPDSIFSYEIFGHSAYERKNIPAYIDLKGKYLHPLSYYMLKRLNRKFESVILGVGGYKIDEDGQLVEDKDGETGLDFLYKNWEKLKFKERSSVFAMQRIENLKNKEKNWIDKWIVLPAFYRDVNFNEEGRPSYDEINDKYLSIIRLVNSVANQEQYGLVTTITKSRIQLLLNEIHDMIVETHLRKKHGVFKRYVLGKNIDYGARIVISAPIIEGDKYDDVQVRFNRVGVPLETVCSIFFPFVVYHTREFLQNEFQLSGKYPYINEKGETEYLTLKNPEYYFSDDYIIKSIKKFIFGVDTRFDVIPLPENEEGRKGVLYLVGKFGKTENPFIRPLTWTDILYRVCYDNLQDKHIYFTRYPIEDSFGINPSKFTILTTRKTSTVTIGDKVYKFYPNVIPNTDSSSSFIQTLHVHNSYLPGLGGDYDGDMLNVTGVWSDEANQDAEAYTKDKKYILSLTMENMRIIQRDYVQTLYSFTKLPKGEGIPEFKNLSRVAKF